MFIDLGLRSKSRPRLKRELCLAFDSIYNGQSPTEAISELQKEDFPLKLNSIAVIAHLVQLMVIEQEFNYLGPSKFEPKTLFFQGWIRAFLDSFKEIDNLCEFFDKNSIIPNIREIHLGGGSPSVMNAEEMERLVKNLGKLVDYKSLNEFSLEIDVRTVDCDQVLAYAD